MVAGSGTTVSSCQAGEVSDTMSAYRIVEWEQPPRFQEVEVPEPGAGEVLVEVAGNGLCHSDIGMAHIPAAIGEAIGWQMPFTLGHEVAGRVAALGTGVEDLAVGDAVAATSPTSCGRCAVCVRGRDALCVHGSAGRGYGRDGGLARYVLVGSRREILPLGTLDPVLAGPLTDAGATSQHAVRRVLPHLVPGATAVVLGAGGLGSYAVQLLRAQSGATVVAVDPNPARRSYAAELGAHHVLDGVDDDTIGDLRALGEGGVDAVLDFVGIETTIAAGLASLRAGGAFGLVGAGQGRAPKGSLMSALPHDGMVFTFQRSDIADALDVMALAESGALRVDVDLYPLSRVAEAYEDMEAGRLRGRAVITPDP
jgi:propanol-preferring alcohol dehydrogenase